MEDDFFEEEDNIFDEDDVLDYIIYDEIEKEFGKKNSTGCLSTIILTISPFGGFIILALWIVG
jgi:hypothetical protein